MLLFFLLYVEYIVLPPFHKKWCVSFLAKITFFENYLVETHWTKFGKFDIVGKSKIISFRWYQIYRIWFIVSRVNNFWKRRFFAKKKHNFFVERRKYLLHCYFYQKGQNLFDSKIPPTPKSNSFNVTVSKEARVAISKAASVFVLDAKMMGSIQKSFLNVPMDSSLRNCENAKYLKNYLNCIFPIWCYLISNAITIHVCYII